MKMQGSHLQASGQTKHISRTFGLTLVSSTYLLVIPIFSVHMLLEKAMQ